MASKITPLGDRILVEQVEGKIGSIIVAGDAKFLHGKVLAIGEGLATVNKQRMPIKVKVGDLVIYGNVQSTIDDTLNGKPVMLMQQAAIVAVYKD